MDVIEAPENRRIAQVTIHRIHEVQCGSTVGRAQDAIDATDPHLTAGGTLHTVEAVGRRVTDVGPLGMGIRGDQHEADEQEHRVAHEEREQGQSKVHKGVSGRLQRVFMCESRVLLSCSGESHLLMREHVAVM